MKLSERHRNKIGKYTIHVNITPRTWAIIIMPPEIRIDNANGFVHIHFSLRGKHHPINKKDFNHIPIA
jgi:hypothetical protein